MPKSLGGIQGMNLWNILIFNVVLAWWRERTQEGRELQLPRSILVLGLLFIGVITWGFLRLVLDPAYIDDFSFLSATSEYFINAVKWVVPGILLADGARTEGRVKIAVFALLSVYILLAIQVIRWMPISYISSGDALSARASKLIQNEIGYNRVTLSNMLAGASWAILAALPLLEKRSHKFLACGCAGIVLMGQALTGGRTGYISWATVGLVLCIVRWRRLLPVLPVAAFIVLACVPAVRERALQGVGSSQGMIVSENDSYEMTSGRTLIWPYVIEKIKEEPITGYGRRAMIRTGMFKYLEEQYNELFAHPHNAYLEILLDNGVIGFVVVVPLYILLLGRSLKLFRRPDDRLANVVGGITSAILIALLVGSLGGQTFYPREGSVPMWAAIGLTLGLSINREIAAESQFTATDENEFAVAGS